MMIFYLITTAILWVCIFLNIAALIRSSKLSKQQKKSLLDLNNLHQDCEKAYAEMMEEKEAYQEAKKELLATMAPDLDEATEDDIPPHRRGET